MNLPEYRPNLSGDKAYLENVASSIKAKEKLEDIRFEYLNEFLQTLGIDRDPYTLINIEDLNSIRLQKFVTEVFEKLQENIIGREIHDKLTRLWDYLAEEDSLQNADLVFVFGGAGLSRSRKAVELYKNEVAPKIIFTGKQPSYSEDVSKSEAEIGADFALDHGVPEESIILEMESKNTPENVINSLQILKEMSLLPKKIILVTNSYHMRRSYYTFKAALDFPTELIRRTSEHERFNRDTFFKDRDGFTYVIYEYIKMYGARLMKHF